MQFQAYLLKYLTLKHYLLYLYYSIIESSLDHFNIIEYIL